MQRLGQGAHVTPVAQPVFQGLAPVRLYLFSLRCEVQRGALCRGKLKEKGEGLRENTR